MLQYDNTSTRMRDNHKNNIAFSRPLLHAPHLYMCHDLFFNTYLWLNVAVFGFYGRITRWTNPGL